ncbi:ATP:cob(I)alamin adenosyltransferase [Tepiditoga spiralis]|uniref:Corrinoid adenosyltransferase n=1 Tax=Tepiditoga spiralis TaxID=2108365 RepID=A0A7G1G510_9BACT|nr:cob(I)yrinic acid a,c-diamide adenosyltransferase [Tepiditoga spiralis]BBE31640.1 ATP:cob(I)alamin adenosyltransferase [Tepiditoga spiralis]
MSISTKTGDNGYTNLWSGERISKDDLRVDTYGTIDELNSFLGEAFHYLKSFENKRILSNIQKTLFRVGGEIASKSKIFTKPIEENDVEYLTSLVKKFEDTISLKGFIIPGKTLSSSKLDVCRTIARRSERLIIKLSNVEKINNNLQKYINRLSDLLFMMARFEEYLEDKIEYL